MRVRFWGTRGSISVAGPETVRYGGNTVCVEVRTDDGTLIILDCGTGARKLGLALASASEPVRAHLLITHTHADHIQGLPFFVPVFLPGSQLTIYGPAGIDRSFPMAISGQMEYAYFPVPISTLPSQLDFVELEEGTFTVGGARIRTRFLNHTAPCLGYRIEADGGCLVYATDHEQHAASYWRPDREPGTFEADGLIHPSDRQHAEFLRGADLLIHDSQYVAEEYPAKVGWGHSTVEYVMDMARVARVKSVALFHYDPSRDDDAVERLLAETRESLATDGATATEVLAAAEGLELLVPARQSEVGDGDAEEDSSLAGGTARVLVVDDDDLVAQALVDVLEMDGYRVTRASGGKEAIALTAENTFDLIMLDLNMPDMNGDQVCHELRANPHFRDTPIIMVTARDDQESLMAGFAEGVTDYITKPFAISQLRARVRSWLRRQPAVSA